MIASGKRSFGVLLVKALLIAAVFVASLAVGPSAIRAADVDITFQDFDESGTIRSGYITRYKPTEGDLSLIYSVDGFADPPLDEDTWTLLGDGSVVGGRFNPRIALPLTPGTVYLTHNGAMPTGGFATSMNIYQDVSTTSGGFSGIGIYCSDDDFVYTQYDSYHAGTYGNGQVRLQWSQGGVYSDVIVPVPDSVGEVHYIWLGRAGDTFSARYYDSTPSPGGGIEFATRTLSGFPASGSCAWRAYAQAGSLNFFPEWDNMGLSYERWAVEPRYSSPGEYRTALQTLAQSNSTLKAVTVNGSIPGGTVQVQVRDGSGDVCDPLTFTSPGMRSLQNCSRRVNAVRADVTLTASGDKQSAPTVTSLVIETDDDVTGPVVTHGCETFWNPDCHPTASDADSGVASSTFYVREGDGGAWSSVGPANAWYYADSRSLCSGMNLDDGYYDPRVEAFDNLGNESDQIWDVPDRIRCDRTDPGAPTLVRGSDRWTNGAIQLNGTATDNLSGIDDTSVTIQRAPSGSGSWTNAGTTALNCNSARTSCTFSFSESPAQGDYDYRVAAVMDGAGNIGSNSNVVDAGRDTADPGLTLSRDSDRWTNGAVELSGTATDNLSGIDDTSVTIQRAPSGSGSWMSAGTAALNCNGARTSCTFSFSDSPADGDYDYRVASVTDRASNTGANSAAVDAGRDTQAPNEPSLVLSEFACGSWNPTSLAASDNGDNGPSGVASVECKVGGGSWGTCPNDVSTLAHSTVILAHATDNAGNQSGDASTTIQRDEQDPPTPTGSAMVLSETAIRWQSDAGSDNGPAGFLAYVWTPGQGGVQSFTRTGLMPNTQYSQDLEWEDDACNTSGPTTLARWTWPLAPVVTATRNTGEWYGPGLGDAYGATGNQWRFVNQIANGFQAGTFEYYSYAFVQSATPPGSGWQDWTAGDAITLTADAGSGDYYLHVRSYNGEDVPHGGTGSPTTATYGPYRWDATDPDVEPALAAHSAWPFPLDAERWTNQPITLTGTPDDLHSGVAGASLFVGGDNKGTYTAGMDVTTFLAEGSNILSATVTDNVGNEGWDATVVRYDTTPPSSVDLLSPVDGAVVTDTARPTFSWQTATDAEAGVRGYTLTVHSDAVDQWCANTACQIITPLDTGVHTWTVTAVDNAGNAQAASEVFQLIVGAPQLDVAKHVDLSVVPATGALHYDIVLRNRGGGSAGAVSIQDFEPLLTTYVSGSLTWSGTAVAPQWVPGSPGHLAWSTADLPAGAVVSLGFDVVVDGGLTDGTTIANSAIWNGGGTGGEATVTSTVGITEAALDLAIDKQAATAVRAGDRLTYTVTVRNERPGARGTAQLWDTIPVSTTFAEIVYGPATYDPADDQIEATVELSGQASAEVIFAVTIDADAPADTWIENAAWAVAAGNSPVVDVARTQVVTGPVVGPDFAYAKEANAAAVAPGDLITYILTVDNSGDTAGTVHVHDPIPAPATFVHDFGAGIYDGLLDAIVADVTVDAAGSETLRFVVRVPQQPTVTVPSTIDNLATFAYEGNFETVANSVLVRLTPDPGVPDLTASWKDVSHLTAAPGDTITYTITVSNSGDGAADVYLVDGIPYGTSYVDGSLTASAGSATFNGAVGRGQISYDHTLAAGGQAQITFAVAVDAGFTQGQMRNVALLYDHVHPDGLTVVSPWTTVAMVDLIGSKTSIADDPLVAGEGTITYTLGVTNAGTLAATNVVVTDDLPGQVTLLTDTVSVESGNWDWDGDVLAWTIPTLGVGEGVFATFVVTVNAGTEGQTIANSMFVTGTEVTDPEPPEVYSDLAIAKTAVDADGGATHIGDVIGYRVWVTNTGTGDQTDLRLSDTLPITVSYVAGSLACSPGATCADDTAITASLATLAAGEALTLTFEVEVLARALHTETQGARVVWVPDPSWVCNVAYGWSTEQAGMVAAEACSAVVPRTVYLPLALR